MGKLKLKGGSQFFAFSLQYGQNMAMLTLKSVWKTLERVLSGGLQDPQDEFAVPLSEGLIHDELG